MLGEGCGCLAECSLDLRAKCRCLEQHEDHSDDNQEHIGNNVPQAIKKAREHAHDKTRIEHVFGAVNHRHEPWPVGADLACAVDDIVESFLVRRNRRGEFRNRTTNNGADKCEDQCNNRDYSERCNDCWHSFFLHPQHRTNSYQGEKQRNQERYQQRLGKLHAVYNHHQRCQADNYIDVFDIGELHGKALVCESAADA